MANLTLNSSIEKLFQLALEEDGRDITAEALNIHLIKQQITTKIVAKEKGIFSGEIVIKIANEKFDINAKLEVKDGDLVDRGQILGTLTAAPSSLLSIERIILNLIQRCSGITTKTHKFVEIAEKYDVKVYDTRKTPPGYRLIDKYAVRCGGGVNHRLGLQHGHFFKENHFIYSKGFNSGIEHIKKMKTVSKSKTIIETRNSIEAKLAINSGFKWVLLDNFSLIEITEFVNELIESDLRNSVWLEYSGNVTEANLPEICKTGINSVSVGELTHSVRAFDISIMGD